MGKSSAHFFRIRKCGWNIVIAIESGHFLCNISAAKQILAECRDRQHFSCRIVFDLKCREVRQLRFFINICSEICIDPFRIEEDLFFFYRIRINVDRTADHISCIQLFDQLAGADQRRKRIVRIQSFFIFTGSICPHAEALCGKTVVGSVKAGAFKHQCLDIIRDLGIFAAHDAGNADRAFCVVDH